MLNKLDLILNLISNKKIDGVLLFSDINRYWFLNFKSSFGYLFINKIGKSILLTDSRYYLSAKNSALNVDEIFLLETNLLDSINFILDKLNIKSLGIEFEYCTVKDYNFFQKFNCDILNLETKQLRIQKDKNEIEKLQIAADIAANTINWIKKQNIIGKTEIEVARMISIHMLESGASGNSFDPIVASGKNGAIPHHSPSEKIINENELVTIDIGCIYEGYCSDITRTFATGNNIDKELINIYNCVLEAQELGIKNSSLEKTGKDIDYICRKRIEDNNYGEYFTHSTGHGVGLEVHEYPNISINSSTVLCPNYVYTIEPGIYINNFGGVRIEDTIYIDEENNVHVLTSKANKDLYINK